MSAKPFLRNDEPMTTIKLVFQSMRPRQWLVKNSFILAPMVFALAFSIQNLALVFAVLILFSLLCGAIYLLNDCFDKPKDIRHPVKKNRPVASGRLKVPTAVTYAVFLIVLVHGVVALIRPGILWFFLLYLFLNLVYSARLKDILILDVIIIAIGFVIRVLIGGAVLNIELSPWILVATFLLSIFLGLIKRRQELIRMGLGEGDLDTRSTLKHYTVSLLDQLIAITTASTLIAYIMYVLDDQVRHRLSENLFYTLPFVVFGIFRYLYLTYSGKKGESPEEIVFSDYPFTINILLWGIVFVLIIYHS